MANGFIVSEWLRVADPQGASVDWWMLNAGWAMVDAVLTSGANLRHEPEVTYIPR